jgi:hypothetical protein
MGQIHGHLAREGCVGAAPGALAQILRFDLERHGDGELEDLLEVAGGAPAYAMAEAEGIAMQIGNFEMHNRNPRLSHSIFGDLHISRQIRLFLAGIFYFPQ